MITLKNKLHLRHKSWQTIFFSSFSCMMRLCWERIGHQTAAFWRRCTKEQQFHFASDASDSFNFHSLALSQSFHTDQKTKIIREKKQNSTKCFVYANK